MAPNIHEAFDRLKEQGKARFLGVSTHTPNLEEVANTAIDSGRFDVMMLAYHFGMWPTLRAHPREGQAARRRHRRDEDAEGRASTPNLADVPRRGRRVLAGRVPLGAVESRRRRAWWSRSRSREHVDEYLAASGTALRAERRRRCSSATTSSIARRLLPAALRRLPRLVPRAARRSTTCCATACTSRDYGWEKEGHAAVRRARSQRLAVRGLPGAVRRHVPARRPDPEAMMDAHRRLTL